MRDSYDFSDAVKNPFAGMIKGKYTVTIHYDFTKQDRSEDEDDMTDMGIARLQEGKAKYGSI